MCIVVSISSRALTLPLPAMVPIGSQPMRNCLNPKEQQEKFMKEVSCMGTKNYWLAFLIGASAGAAVALLCAPQSGAKTRKQLRKGVEEAGDYLEDAGDYLKSQAERFASEAHKAVERAKDQVDSVVDKASDVVSSAVKNAQSLV